jgi:NADPH:quinone reductase-like Zn-dependent oxidoreductase
VICAGVNADDVYFSKQQQTPSSSADSSHTSTSTTDRVGFALSGVVERVGAHVRSFQVGNSVCAVLPLLSGGGGAFATHVIVPEELLVPKLRRVSFALAASSALAASIAYAAVQLHCAARAGDVALVVNPSCVEGVLVCRLLCALKCVVAVLVHDSAERALLVPVLPSQVRYIDDLYDLLSGGERFDHIIELRPCRAPGEPHVESTRVVEALAAHGTWVVCHQKPRELNAALTAPMMRKSARLAFCFEHTWAAAATTRGTLCAALLDFQKRLVAGSTSNGGDALPDLLSLDDDGGGSAANDADLATDDGALTVPTRSSIAIRPLEVRCFDASEADSAIRHARATMQLQAVAIRFEPEPSIQLKATASLL